ncbi:GWxTD domain-containing protein [Acidobacteria bacterium AH-259-O06]|nr:GWxTD domain-containing protein [Acidobacteria bacterium AH-259-O06]
MRHTAASLLAPRLGALLFLMSVIATVPAGPQRDQKRLAQEEREDYYAKWLNEYVVYSITDEEQKVFEALTAPEEKEQFIEQFWFRRDPDPTTSVNEFKEEHYRRIAYANEHFSAGMPGWKTDRGRIYILHGPPDQIESYPTGGPYFRPAHEGGGATTAYPFERWWYRYIEGVGSDIELEFVDQKGTAFYKLALDPAEKDALLHVPGLGKTAAEMLGLAEKRDRPFFSPGNRESYPLQVVRAADNPFQRYETYARVQAPKPIRYTDLKKLVKVEVTYTTLPFELRKDYFRLNERQLLVPVTFQVENKNLTFKKEGEVYRARVAVYGIVTSLTHRIVAEFDDDLVLTYAPEQFERGLLQSSQYQKVLFLEDRMRYRLDLVVKDVHSGNVGVRREALAPPSSEDGKLSVSSLILSSQLWLMKEIPAENTMFVLGDVKIRPSIDRRFSASRPLYAYLHVYNPGLDQSTLAPALSISFRILRDGQPVLELAEESGESIQNISGQWVVLIRELPTRQLKSGAYRIQVDVRDRIKGEKARVEETFEIVEAQPRQEAERK